MTFSNFKIINNIPSRTTLVSFSIKGQEGIGDGAGLKIPDTYHFLPNDSGYFFSQIIPRNVSDDVTGNF